MVWINFKWLTKQFEQFIDCASNYSSDIPLSDLQLFLNDEFEGIESNFRERIEEKLCFNLVKTQFPILYGIEMKIPQIRARALKK